MFILEEHAYQQFIGCAFNNEGQVSRFWRYGYDGRYIMHVDLAKEAVVATSEPGHLLAEERKSKEYIKRKEARLVKVCSAVKTVFLKSNNSLSRAGIWCLNIGYLKYIYCIFSVYNQLVSNWTFDKQLLTFQM